MLMAVEMMHQMVVMRRYQMIWMRIMISTFFLDPHPQILWICTLLLAHYHLQMEEEDFLYHPHPHYHLHHLQMEEEYLLYHHLHHPQ